MVALTKYPEPLVFGLDIGTRSIVGTVGYQDGKQFNIVAQCVKFHDTRAMLDGQIHDITKVGEEIIYVKEELEKQLSNQLLTQHELMINSFGIDTWWLEEAQVGIASLSSNADTERILLFQQFVFMDQQQLDFCLLFNSINCSGRLNTNGTYDPLNFDKLDPSADAFSSLQNQLIAEGFSLNHQLKRNFLDDWTYSGLVDVIFSFNLGQVSILKINSKDYQYTTQLKHIAFSLTHTQPIESADYLLIWQGYIYERPFIHRP